MQADNSCTLKPDVVEPVHKQPTEDEETSEVILWTVCQPNAQNKGYLCPGDEDKSCLLIDNGDFVDCATWLDVVEQDGVISNCNDCTDAVIENCATQSGIECIECAPGYSLHNQQECVLEQSCSEGEESTDKGCIVPAQYCSAGYSVMTDSGNVQCQLCNPGYKITNNLCKELDDPTNCDQVEMTNPYRKCEVCAKGFQRGTEGLCTVAD